MPGDMALGQVVPFEVTVLVNSVTTPENGVMSFTGQWLAKTTNGSAFGFDPTYGLIAAFVDYSDYGTSDPEKDATVTAFSCIVK